MRDGACETDAKESDWVRVVQLHGPAGTQMGVAGPVHARRVAMAMAMAPCTRMELGRQASPHRC